MVVELTRQDVLTLMLFFPYREQCGLILDRPKRDSIVLQ